MGKRIVIVLLILLPFTVYAQPFRQRVNIHGGIIRTKRMSLWEIHRYKDTELLRKYPLCYAPWKAYIAVDRYVEVRNINNYNCLVIKTDLAKIVSADAKYNKAYAKRFKGNVQKIYKFCTKTKYVLHNKTARDAFQKRKADCAGIAAAFYVLCKAKKIPVRYIIGWYDGECHAWNRVKIRKKWYYVDCTWKRKFSKKLWKKYSIMESW